MIDLNNTNLFESISLPGSNIAIYVLKNRVAPIQEAFYFVNNSITDDGRYLWFYCAFPPSGTAAEGRSLGVVDFQKSIVTHFPETQFGEASPYVDVVTGEAYWQTGRYVWKRKPDIDATVEYINCVPEDLIKDRNIIRTATHLTRSADGKNLFIDMGLPTKWLFGNLPINGDDFKLWYQFDRLYNHAQFSPTNNNEILFAEEFHNDPITGLVFPIINRLWTMKYGEEPRPILPKPLKCCHECWDPDGKHVWCVEDQETWCVCIETGDIERIKFPVNCWHSHCTADGKFIVCDSMIGSQRGSRSKVSFMNRESSTVITFADNPIRDDYSGRNYHIDPHPRFCCHDKYVVFTTTMRGNIDVAIVPIESLINATI